jgi:hypothetical protein
VSGNGNGRFKKYHKRVSEKAGLTKNEPLLPFAPDWWDSLVRRMAIPTDTAEQTFAWLEFRAGGNQSEHAIHLYSKNGEAPVETDLHQRDCCLELAWLMAGHRAEWLDAPLEMFREEAKRRGVEPVDKSLVSDGFTFNRLRGTVASGTGYLLVLVPSPNPEMFCDSTEHCRRKSESPAHKKFIEWAKVAHSTEFAELEVARSTVKRISRFLLSAYQKEQRSGAPQSKAAPSLEALEASEALEPTPQSVSRSSSPASPPDPTRTDRPTDTPTITNSPVPDDAAGRMESLLLEEIGDRFPGEVPRRSLCLQCIERLGDADWAEFGRALRTHKWKAGDVMGKARSIAEEVHERWLKDVPKRRQQRADEEARVARQATEMEAEEAITQRALEAWESLAPEDKAKKEEKARRDLKARYPNLPPQQLADIAEGSAKRDFIREYAANASQSGGGQEGEDVKGASG